MATTVKAAFDLPDGVRITAPIEPGFEAVLSHDALALVARLHRKFETRRRKLSDRLIVRRRSKKSR